ncbi:MAG: hypothetical protein WBP61_10575 [Nocardioides sp.]
MGPRLRRIGQVLLAVIVYGVVAAVVCLPLALERAIESASFSDRLGTLPVEVSLAHDGVVTLDTGVLGSLYWARTGVGGFGAHIESTGPPAEGGTLSSYVSPEFLRANVAFVEDPDTVAGAYADGLRRALVDDLLRSLVAVALLGGIGLTAVFRARPPSIAGSRRRRVVISTLVVAGAVGASSGLALHQFRSWEGTDPLASSYPMPGIESLSFSSPQTREIAEQIQPFVEKNTARVAERTAAYRDAVASSLASELPARADDLAARDGEVVVLAEADPQGSLVGTAVRTSLYPALEEHVGDERLVLRTISGDVSSNGTLAEADFVARESAASPGVPTVAVKGDHDTDTTVGQLGDNGVPTPDLEVIDAGGLRVAGAADPAFKALFGGKVVNETGVTEEDLGRRLRDVVEEDGAAGATVVLVHQLRAALAYLGLDSREDLEADGSATEPWDDGIPDLPPGLVNYGHLHDADGPWVVWNTDGDLVTWTVVSQLGTSGGVEENPTFNRFSTPFSVPLKAVSLQLQYVNEETGLPTGFVPIAISTDGTVEIGERVDVGLPGGVPVPVEPGTLESEPNDVPAIGEE